MTQDYPTWPEMYTPPEQRPARSPETTWPKPAPAPAKQPANPRPPAHPETQAATPVPRTSSDRPAARPAPTRNARIVKLVRARRMVFGGILASSIGAFAAIASHGIAATNADTGGPVITPTTANAPVSRSVIVIPTATPSPTTVVADRDVLSAIKRSATAASSDEHAANVATATTPPEPTATEVPTLEPTPTEEPPVHTRTKTS